MSYNERVVLIFEKESEGFLGDDVTYEHSDPIPCQRSGLTNAEQMGIFGKYNLDSFKLHLQGHYDGFSRIVFDGKERSIAGKKYHKHSTVIYL